MANEKYDVVVLGGGAVGAATLWHLAQMGLSAVLLERKKLTSGTTWHAAGLVGQMRLTHALARIACYGVEFMKDLSKNAGTDIGFKQPGSISVALNDERFHEFKRLKDISRYHGVKIEVLPPEGLRERYPYLNIDGVVGATYTHGDGQVNPIDLTQAMVKAARQKGAVVKENCKVTKIITAGRKVLGVETEAGTIDCDNIILCGGMWSRDIAKSVGVSLPLQAAEHFYIVTEPMADCPRDMPVIRVPDEFAYYKEDAGKILLGAFEPGAKTWGLDGIPEDFEFDTLPEDFDHFEQVFNMALNRFPMLEKAGINLFFNGPESFTPDVKFHIGRAPAIDNFFVATGFNSTGIQTAPGAGKMIAEWVKNGYPSEDLSGNEPSRLQFYTNSKEFLKDRTTETLGLLYALHYPYRQFETGRGVRRSPFHHAMLAQGAVMSEAGGWERPGFFKGPDNNGKLVDGYHYSWFLQNWHDRAMMEGITTRDRVALYDQCSFHKFMVMGTGALPLLNHLSCNNIDVKIGKVVYTQWLNDHGGVEADLTITRLGENQFMVVTGSASGVRDLTRLQKYQSQFSGVEVIDISAGMAMLGIMGPESRKLLSLVTGEKLENLDNQHFPFGTSREFEIGYAPVRVSRLTYVGELGYEIYVSSEMGEYVIEKILAAGKDVGLGMAGYHCLNSCRLEKAYRHYGHDMAWHDNLVESGLAFTARMNKKDFIGKAATATAMEKAEKLGAPSRRLVQFYFNDATPKAPLCYHEEAIVMQGKPDQMVGMVTSGAWGYRLNKSIGMGYVTNKDGVSDDWLKQQKLAVVIGDQEHGITAQIDALYDPSNQKIKS
ncbi:MAG: FAD-dependent oxidoreductase [Hydrotalea sp.]|nr:FAD-dependent oxidoreductase [Hydrotalea sp.]